jgi:anti-anti-sigma factor
MPLLTQLTGPRCRGLIALFARGVALTHESLNPSHGQQQIMELHVSNEQGYILASTVGPIDDSAADLFRERLHPVVAQRGTKLVLDLAKSPRVNSVGLGHLVKLATDANLHGSQVVVAACSPFVSAVLERSKLDRFFDLAESVPEAVDRVLER